MNTRDAIARAGNLAQSALGATAPNPIVGAVILAPDGSLISEGFHNRQKSPDHAEIVALKIAGKKANGATIVISLEPCNHQGSTGACVDAIITAGISQVIYVQPDLNKIAAGGAARLAAAGISVEQVSDVAVEFANRSWRQKISTGLPLITWKIATTLDGRVAAADGTSAWITSEQSRADVQLLRRQSDAIVIGTGTALADNPHLTPRVSQELQSHYLNNPVRIVMGRRELPAVHNLFDASAETVLIQSRDIKDLIAVLKERSFNSVLIEAGPTLGSALVQAGLVDEIIHYLAPTLLGAGQNFLSDIGIATLTGRINLELISSTILDGDLKNHYRIKSGA